MEAPLEHDSKLVAGSILIAGRRLHKIAEGPFTAISAAFLEGADGQINQLGRGLLSGNEPRVLMDLRITWFRLSMAFVV